MKKGPFRFRPEVPNYEIKSLFNRLIGEYWGLVQEIRDIEKGRRGGSNDFERQRMLAFVNKEKHRAHLKLLEIGKKLGLDKNDVLIRILIREGSLKEYDLPEIPISIAEDGSSVDIFFGIDNTGLKDIYGVEDEEEEKRFQAEFETNARKAKDLAEKNGLLFFDHEEGLSTHDQTRSIGVTVPKERLEEIAGLMPNNTKYKPQL